MIGSFFYIMLISEYILSLTFLLAYFTKVACGRCAVGGGVVRSGAVRVRSSQDAIWAIISTQTAKWETVRAVTGEKLANSSPANFNSTPTKGNASFAFI